MTLCVLRLDCTQALVLINDFNIFKKIKLELIIHCYCFVCYVLESARICIPILCRRSQCHMLVRGV